MNYGPLVGGWKKQPFTSKEIESIEYIRKDVVDEMLKTAEDHAYFAGKEKMREELLKWAYEDLDPAAYLQLKDKLNEM